MRQNKRSEKYHELRETIVSNKQQQTIMAYVLRDSDFPGVYFHMYD